MLIGFDEGDETAAVGCAGCASHPLSAASSAGRLLGETSSLLDADENCDSFGLGSWERIAAIIDAVVAVVTNADCSLTSWTGGSGGQLCCPALTS